MVSPLLALSCEWSVHKFPLGTSYHLPIHLNFSQVDWETYKDHVQSLLADLNLCQQSAIEAYITYCNTLRNAVHLSIIGSRPSLVLARSLNNF